jgi:hypothetical protein
MGRNYQSADRVDCLLGSQGGMLHACAMRRVNVSVDDRASQARIGSKGGTRTHNRAAYEAGHLPIDCTLLTVDRCALRSQGRIDPSSLAI